MIIERQKDEEDANTAVIDSALSIHTRKEVRSIYEKSTLKCPR